MPDLDRHPEGLTVREPRPLLLRAPGAAPLHSQLARPVPPHPRTILPRGMQQDCRGPHEAWGLPQLRRQRFQIAPYRGEQVRRERAGAPENQMTRQRPSRDKHA